MSLRNCYCSTSRQIPEDSIIHFQLKYAFHDWQRAASVSCSSSFTRMQTTICFAFPPVDAGRPKKTHGFRLNRRVLPGGSLRRLPLEVTTNLCVPSVRGGRVSDGPRGICLPFAQPCCLLMMPSAAADIRRVPEFIFPRRRGEERRGAEWWRERFIHWVLEWLIRGNHFIFGSPTF